MARSERVSGSPRRRISAIAAAPRGLASVTEGPERRQIGGRGADSRPASGAPTPGPAQRGSSGPCSSPAALAISALDALSRRSTAAGLGQTKRGEQHGIAVLKRRVRIRHLRGARDLQLGNPHPRRADLHPQHHQLGYRSSGTETLEPLVAHPLGREPAQAGRRRSGRFPGEWVDGEVEPGREADAPGGSGDSPPGIAAPGPRPRAPVVWPGLPRRRTDPATRDGAGGRRWR